MAEGTTVSAAQTQPGRSADQIREDIVAHRAAIASLASDVERRLQRELDWRTHVSRRPLAAVAIAAAAGAAMVLCIRAQRRTPLQRIAKSVSDTVEDLRGQLGETLEDLAGAARGRSRARHEDDRRTTRAAVAGAIGNAALDFVRQKLTQPSRDHGPSRAETRSTPATS
jgi:hypothetical protein